MIVNSVHKAYRLHEKIKVKCKLVVPERAISRMRKKVFLAIFKYVQQAINNYFRKSRSFNEEFFDQYKKNQSFIKLRLKEITSDLQEGYFVLKNP